MLSSTTLLPTKPIAKIILVQYNNKPKRQVDVISSKQADIDCLAKFQLERVIENQSKGVTTSWRKQNDFDPDILRESYESCRKICAQHATSYLGTLLLTEERKKAIWAIYAWGQRTDDLVDGPNSDLTTSTDMERWEERLEAIFNGCPYDLPDAALADTVQRFSLDVKPFKDLIKGMKMDTWKARYDSFEELELYMYYVAGTIGLMTVPILGIPSEGLSQTRCIYNTALCLAFGKQLTNILRDVEEDAVRGRIYLPQDELREFGLTDEDVVSRKVTEEWRAFMRKQIARARSYFDEAEKGISQLDRASRWPVWASSLFYRKMLDKIEDHQYDNLTKRASLRTADKLQVLPKAYAKAMGWN